MMKAELCIHIILAIGVLHSQEVLLMQPFFLLLNSVFLTDFSLSKRQKTI